MKAIITLTLAIAAMTACAQKPATNNIVTPNGPTGLTDITQTDIGVRVGTKPYTHRNLTIYLLSGDDNIATDYLTLAQAMEEKQITLHETGSVNELSVDNHSGKPVFIMAGDIVKGGRQDRTIGEDIVLKPKAKNIPLSSFCVERSRWSSRGAESAAEFSVSENVLSDKSLKVAARSAKDQGKVWAEVDAFQNKVSDNIGKSVKSDVSATSLQLTLEDKDLRASVEEYIAALSPAFTEQENVVGFVFCVNGEISTAEWFCNAGLFAQLRDKLLEAAINEAISNLDGEDEYPTPNVSTISAFINSAQSDKPSVGKSAGYMEEHKHETDNSVMFCTFDTDESRKTPIHVSIYQVAKADEPARKSADDEILSLLSASPITSSRLLLDQRLSSSGINLRGCIPTR